jgi:predicted DCC family thiol-disulfide oxidoreductase YuxK
MAPAPDGPIVLFDGVCNLCNWAVQLIIDRERDREPKLRFAPIQSDVGRSLLEGATGAEAVRGSGEPDSIVLVEGGEASTHSTAALRIARHLRPPLGWAFVLLVVPRPIRDAVYRFIARHRYRWFGKTATCRVPTPELAARFLA